MSLAPHRITTALLILACVATAAMLVAGAVWCDGLRNSSIDFRGVVAAARTTSIIGIRRWCFAVLGGCVNAAAVAQPTG